MKYPYKMAGLLSLSVMILALSVLVSRAGESDSGVPVSTGAKKLLLFAKNPTTWAIDKNGGTGKLVYRSAKGTFTLSAEGLQPRSAYALIRYADVPPKAEILARGVSDARGRLELTGTWHNWTKKFWLVAGEDVMGAAGEAGSLRAWRPDRYLLEEKPRGIACECPESEEPS